MAPPRHRKRNCSQKPLDPGVLVSLANNRDRGNINSAMAPTTQNAATPSLRRAAPAKRNTVLSDSSQDDVPYTPFPKKSPSTRPGSRTQGLFKLSDSDSEDDEIEAALHRFMKRSTAKLSASVTKGTSSIPSEMNKSRRSGRVEVDDLEQEYMELLQTRKKKPGIRKRQALLLSDSSASSAAKPRARDPKRCTSRLRRQRKRASHADSDDDTFASISKSSKQSPARATASRAHASLSRSKRKKRLDREESSDSGSSSGESGFESESHNRAKRKRASHVDAVDDAFAIISKSSKRQVDSKRRNPRRSKHVSSDDSNDEASKKPRKQKVSGKKQKGAESPSVTSTRVSKKTRKVPERRNLRYRSDDAKETRVGGRASRKKENDVKRRTEAASVKGRALSHATPLSSESEEDSKLKRVQKPISRKRAGERTNSPSPKKKSQPERRTGAAESPSSSDNDKPSTTKEAFDSQSKKTKKRKGKGTRRRLEHTTPPRSSDANEEDEPPVEWELMRKTITEDEQSQIRRAFTHHYPPPPSNLKAMARFEQKYGREMPKKMVDALWKLELKPWSDRWWKFYLDFSAIARAHKLTKPLVREPILTPTEIKRWAAEYYEAHGDARVPVKLSKNKANGAFPASADVSARASVDTAENIRSDDDAA